MSELTNVAVYPHFPVTGLKTWDKLELVFEEKDRTGRYLSRIEDFESDRILISRPSLISGDALFSVGAVFTAIFIKPDSAYTFSGQVLKKHHGEVEAYWIKAPEIIERNQRRRFYRIETDARVKVILLNDYQTALEQSGSGDNSKSEAESRVITFEGYCLNVSGNGMLVRTHADIRVHEKVLVSLFLPYFQRDLDLVGIAKRIETHRDGYYRYGIEYFSHEELHTFVDHGILEKLPQRFQKFNENQRTLLLNYIFAQQVALKRKGLV